MSNSLAIRVEHLSKAYTLRGPQPRYRTIRESITAAVTSPFRPTANGASSDLNPRRRTDFLALNDISFAVPRGAAVGVIGHNGAGKSTLLKILSRITEPTAGSATLFGRVGSLLEIGTGFHNELSGRENVYLSGAIIGMKRREIDNRFEEIIAFAEVDQFIDTPIKHYSSGMHLRLAFAVAAHLHPEILLIDEVLAVGDAQFQRKCLGKMGDVTADGRTVLFVSHNLSAMKELCRTGLVLSHGRLLFQGPIVEAISHYTQSTQERDVVSPCVGWQQLRMIKPHGSDWVIRPEDATTYRAVLVLPAQFTQGRVVLEIHASTGDLVVRQPYDIEDFGSAAASECRLAVTASVPPLWLGAGLYTVHFRFHARSALGLEPKYASERRILDVRGWSQDRLGASLAPNCEWSVQPVEVDPASVLEAVAC